MITFDNDKVLEVRLTDDFMATGILPLDIVMRGGLRFGTIIEIVGPRKNAKSDLLYHFLKQGQQVKALTKLIDPEVRLKKIRADQVGLNFEDLRVTEYKYSEDFFESTEGYIRKVIRAREDKKHPFVDKLIYGVDSITVFTDRKESPDDPEKLRLHQSKVTDEKVAEYGKGFATKSAMLFSEFCRRCQLDIVKARIMAIVVNQERQNMMGGKQSATGGNALQYMSNCRIELKHFADWSNGCGMTISMGVTWTTWSPPSRYPVKVDLNYTHGIMPETAIYHALKQGGHLKNKSGGEKGQQRYFSEGLPEDGVPINRFKMEKFLANKEIMKIITRDIKETYEVE
jgi:RecA/RadA recombinase